MEKVNASCLWGDCPNIDHGPTSTEHEGRFAKRSKAVSQLVENNPAMMINGDNVENQAK